MTTPTPEDSDKLRHSVSRLICRHGWQAFAKALHQICRDAVQNQQGYPQAAATWQRRADALGPIIDNQPGPLPITVSRPQAVASGLLVDASQLAAKANLGLPVFLTRAVFDQFVTVPPDVIGQDQEARLWAILWATTVPPSQETGACAMFLVSVANDNHHAKMVKLVAQLGPLDHANPQPALTIMLPEEHNIPL